MNRIVDSLEASAKKVMDELDAVESNPTSVNFHQFRSMIEWEFQILRDDIATGGAEKVKWPQSQSAKRLGDMTPPGDSYLRVLFDSDFDVIVEIWNNERKRAALASVEFCTGVGGGMSQRTRKALIDLMIAIEEDNRDKPQQ